MRAQNVFGKCFAFLRSPRVLDGRMLDGVTRKQFLRIPETEMCLAEPEVTGSCGNSYIQNGIFKVALQRRRLYKRPHSD